MGKGKPKLIQETIRRDMRKPVEPERKTGFYYMESVSPTVYNLLQSWYESTKKIKF